MTLYDTRWNYPGQWLDVMSSHTLQWTNKYETYYWRGGHTLYNNDPCQVNGRHSNLFYISFENFNWHSSRINRRIDHQEPSKHWSCIKFKQSDEEAHYTICSAVQSYGLQAALFHSRWTWNSFSDSLTSRKRLSLKFEKRSAHSDYEIMRTGSKWFDPSLSKGRFHQCFQKKNQIERRKRFYWLRRPAVAP